MRVNVYASELPGKVEIVEKTKDGDAYVGARFVSHDDNQSNAVTFWARNANDLRAIFNHALAALEQPVDRAG